MISREQLAKEYIRVIDNYYPVAGRLLRHCVIKIINLSADRSQKPAYYLGIYYPERIIEGLLVHTKVLRDTAESMGLVEVVLFNANRLIKDPQSKIKRQDFRFWLELCWIASEIN